MVANITFKNLNAEQPYIIIDGVKKNTLLDLEVQLSRVIFQPQVNKSKGPKY